MKNMKKLLALMLVLTMVFAMAACGSEPKGSISSSDSTASKSAPEAAPKSTPEPTPEPEPEESVELGSMVGGTYENDFVGIGCRLDDSWQYLTDEEILEMNDLVVDSLDNEELAEQLSKKNTFYDMVAMADEGLTTVNVVIENLGLLYGTALDASSYIDIAMESLDSQFASMGLDVTTIEKTSFDFCGRKTDGIVISGTMTVEGIEVEVYERLACVKAGTYMCCITACTYFEDTTADVLALFYAV